MALARRISTRELLIASACLAGATVMWGVAPVAIYYLQDYIDPYSQNFYRYLAAVAAMFLILGGRQAGSRRRRGVGAWRLTRAFWVAVVFNTAFQTCLALTFYNQVTPAMGKLVFNINILFAAFLEYGLHPEERAAFFHPLKSGGLVAILVGSAGVIVFREGGLAGRFTVGVVIMLVGAVCWAFYSAAVKGPSHSMGPLNAFAGVSVFTALGLGVLALAMGDLTTLWACPPHVLALVFLSGVFCIAAAHTMYYKAIQLLGFAIPAGVILAAVLVTYLVSWFVLDERLTPLQWASGVVMLGGCVAAVLSRRSKSAPLLVVAD